MKGLIKFIISFSIILSGCGKVSLPEENNAKQLVDSTDLKPFANPLIIQGSSFGHFFQGLYRLNRFDDMIRYTSVGLKVNNSEIELKMNYKELDFGFELGKLGSTAYNGDTVTLIYPNSIRFGTRVKTQVICVIEKDTARFVNLKNEDNLFNK